MCIHTRIHTSPLRFSVRSCPSLHACLLLAQLVRCYCFQLYQCFSLELTSTIYVCLTGWPAPACVVDTYIEFSADVYALGVFIIRMLMKANVSQLSFKWTVFSLFLGEIKMLNRHCNNLPFRSFVGCIQANRKWLVDTLYDSGIQMLGNISKHGHIPKYPKPC